MLGIRTEEKSHVSSNRFATGFCFSRSYLRAFVGQLAQRGGRGWQTTLTPQSELPLLFYTLIALALPLRHADLVIVLLSWVFVVTCFAQVGIFATSIDARRRSMASLAGALVLFAMWLYFALRILLLI
jgi:hypothetical protein